MKTRTLTPMGALHPFIFFAGVYAVVLLFSIFICSALFYSCNASKTELVQKQEIPSHNATFAKSSSTGLVER